MKVLITGGTGFVGREVLRQLHAAGHTARLVVRYCNQVGDRLPQPCCPIEVHPGDVTKLSSSSGAAEGCDAVIHLVGIIGEFGSVTFDRLHVEATRNMVAAAQAGGVRRFIHMSALGTRPDAPARYHQTKWAAEELVRGSGLDSTIFRPSVIYGPEDHFVNLFDRMSRWLPFLPVLGSGTNRIQPVSVQVVARCFVGALHQKETHGQTYEVCGPESFTVVHMLDTILRITERKRFKLHIPLPLAWLQAMLLEFGFGSILRMTPPLHRDLLRMQSEDNTGDPAPIERLFDISQEAFADGIRQYLKPRSAL